MLLVRNIPTILLLLIAFAAQAQSVGQPKFEPGQEWSIKSNSPTTAKIVIGGVERWRDRVAIHVSIIDIPVPRGLPGAGAVTQIEHIPFDSEALAASVDRLIATGFSPSPGYDGGYRQWQDAHGGIFTIGVSKAIEMMFQAMNQRQG
jgi:hypothetical protein